MNIEIAPKTTEIQATWYNAQMYCLFLNVNGKTGWRLPTMSELHEIYESDNDLDGYGFYWSSTTGNSHNRNSDSAWCQELFTGYQSPSIKSHNGHFVRPVRDII